MGAAGHQQGPHSPQDAALFGRSLAMRFERLVQGAMKQMRDLPESAKYDLTLRIYDLMQYQDYAFAKRYLELVRGVYRRDSARARIRRHRCRRSGIWPR